MKLSRKIPTEHFILSQVLILIIGLIFLAGLYYILNLQYKITSQPFLNGPVTTLPKTLKLDLDHPSDNSLVFEDSLLISGQATAGREVLIFTDSQNLVVKSKIDGSFSSSLDLDPGVNKITVVVFDNNGDSKQIERIVYYSEEKI